MVITLKFSMVDSETIEPQLRRFLKKPRLVDMEGEIRTRIMEILGITPEVAERADIRILDEVLNDQGNRRLILLHYLYMIPQAVHVRGVIMRLPQNESEKLQIVASSFPYTEEIEAQEENKTLVESFMTENTIITPAYEGTILRLFCVDGEVYLSTHRKINGRNSKWGSAEFGTLFDALWNPENYSHPSLRDETKCFALLLSTPQNRIACNITEPMLTLVGVFARTDGLMSFSLPESEIFVGVPVQYSVKIKPSPDSDIVTTLFQSITEMDWRKCTGYLLTTPQEDNRLLTLKIISPQYAKKRELRGNEPNVRLRYLHLKKNPKLLQEFIDIFPGQEEYFQAIEENLRQLPQYLTQVYQYRYTQKNFLRLPQEEYFVLENVHKSRDPNIPLQQNIYNTLMKSNGRQLNAMIKRIGTLLPEETEESNSRH